MPTRSPGSASLVDRDDVVGWSSGDRGKLIAGMRAGGVTEPTKSLNPESERGFFWQ
jgi:hypothetical protein